MSSINIAAVEYNNTIPFLYGLSEHFDVGELNIIPADPANCARLYANKKVDVALVPVGALPDLGQYNIITDFCIGSKGVVDTVALLSNAPLQEIKSISLDKHSRTSAHLIQVLCHYFWKINPTYVQDDILNSVSSSRLLIGDKVKKMEHDYLYKYDLGEAWNEYTGLPMVFAVWIARKNISSDIVDKLNSAFRFAINNLDSIPLKGITDPVYLRNYLNRSIHYSLAKQERKGMELFVEKCRNLGL